MVNSPHFCFPNTKSLTNDLYFLSRRYGRAWETPVTRKKCRFAVEGSVCWKPLLDISECTYGETDETECPDFAEGTPERDRGERSDVGAGRAARRGDRRRR